MEHRGRPPEPRKMKTSLMQHNEEIAQLYQDQVVDEDSYKSSIRILHSDAVREALDSYAPNRVLGTPPPEIHFSESLLPRPIRSELSRLRSGFSRKLNSYMSRIDTSIEDKCPSCQGSPHNTIHLFNCPDNPTPLEVHDLWTRPAEAARFLSLEIEEDADQLRVG